MLLKAGKIHRTIRFAGLSAAVTLLALGLSGCVGGTTYGTGVSQEKQTLDDVYNMFTLKQKRNNIDYAARPDLIVPENTAALPEPVDVAATTSNTAWPESPGERIARVRAEAGEIDPRTGDYSIQDQLRAKEGIAIEQGYAEKKFIPGVTDRDGNAILYRGQSEASREAVLQRKQELSISKGPTRKFLTEPPIAYRIPVASAPSGEEAYSEEERAAKAELERKLKAEKNAELAGRK